MPNNTSMITNFMNSLFQMEKSTQLNHDELAKSYEKSYPELKKQMIGEPLRDVIGKGEVDDPCFSTNIHSYFGRFDQMNWGYFGQGPCTLARSILYLFTGGDEVFARQHTYDFVLDFLKRGKQSDDLRIKKELIELWIEKRRDVTANNVLFLRAGDNFVQ